MVEISDATQFGSFKFGKIGKQHGNHHNNIYVDHVNYCSIQSYPTIYKQT